VQRTCNIFKTMDKSYYYGWTNRKLHPHFRLTPKSLTLDALERPRRTFAEKMRLRSPSEKINEDRPIIQRLKCRRMILVSRNIRCTQIFVGLPRGGSPAANDSEVVGDCRFLLFRWLLLRKLWT